jgi:hypothetical protein
MVLFIRVRMSCRFQRGKSADDDLSAATFDEAQAVEVATDWVDVVRGKLSKRASREWLVTTLGDYLRRGLIETLKVVEEAEKKGDELSDFVLRLTFSQMSDAGEWQNMPVQLKAYGERAALRPPVKRKPGRATWYDNWLRNIGIATMVHMACEQFGLEPTRSQESRRARRPSGCSVIKAALERKGIHLAEGTVQNIWEGVTGDLVRQAATSPAFTAILAK